MYHDNTLREQKIFPHRALWQAAYPWLVWLLASMFLFYKYLLQVSPSVMVEPLMRQFNLNGQDMGHLAACYFYSYMLMQLPGGLLLDRINISTLISSAILVCASGAFVFALASNFYFACFGRILIGFGGAFSAIGTMKLIAMYFPANRFALVAGLMMTVGMLGAVGGQAPIAHAVTLYGWQTSLLFCSLIGVLLAALVAITVRSLPTENDEQLTTSKLFTHLKALLKNPQCWLISIYSGLAFAPISSFGGLWGVPFLSQKLAIDNTHAASLISMIFIGFSIGCPLSGWLSDKMNRRKPLMFLGTTIGMMLLLIILYMPMADLSLMASLLFAFGFFTSFFFISFANIREINLLVASGTAIGFINTFDAIFGALSEPTIGHYLDKLWDGKVVNGAHVFSLVSYQYALLLLPLAMLASLLILCFVRETFCQSIAK